MRILDHVGPLALGATTVVLALVAAACGGSGEARPTTGAGIYKAYCATCHGADGQGFVGPALAGLMVEKYPDIEDQITVVREGRGEMPAWRGDLTPKEIRTVVEYTRTRLRQ